MRRCFAGSSLGTACFLVGVVWSLLLAAGCGSPHSPANRDASSSGAAERQRRLSGRAVAPAVAQLPGYREAVRRYARKDYAGALARVNALLAAPALTEPERAFLERQRALCQAALTGKPALVAVVAVPALRSAPAAASAADCGPRALLLACRELNVTTSLPGLTRAAGTTKAGTTLAGLAHAAKSLGLKASGVQMDKDALAHLSHPALAWVDGNHYLAVLHVSGDTATIHDPNKETKEEISLSDLLARSGGVLLTLAPRR